MANRSVELLWNFGISDECQVLVVEKRGDLMTIVGEVKDKGRPIQFYAERLNELAAKKGYSYVRSHLPRVAWARSFATGVSPKDVLQSAGFHVEPWLEQRRSERAA